MPRPIAYKTGTIQPPNTAKQSNILVGVGPSNWGAGAANATFYNGLDSSYQYVIIKNSNPPAMWGTGDFTTGSLLTTINGLPDRVGQTRFTNANTAISWSLASGEYSILKNEQPYGGPITNGLAVGLNAIQKNLFINGDFNNTESGNPFYFGSYGGSSTVIDITNDKPYVGSKTTKALQITNGGNVMYTTNLMEVGKTYTFSFWGRKTDGTSGDIGFDKGPIWNNQNGQGELNNFSYPWNGTVLPSTTIDGTWRKYNYTFLYNAARTQFYFYNVTGVSIFTEFQIEEGSTSTTFSSFPTYTPQNTGLINTGSLSLINGAYFGGQKGGAYNFDGIDDRITYPIGFSTWNDKTFTIESWFEWGTGGSNGNYGWFELAGAGGSNWGLSHVPRTGNFYFYWCADGANEGHFIQNSAIQDNVPLHMAITFNGVGGNNQNTLYNNTKVYINGVLQAHSAAGAAGVNSNSSINIGGLGYPFKGNIYTFNYYDRVLSNTEIENIYNAGLPTYQSSSNIMVNQGLTLYLDATNPNCYPGSGTSIYDLSGYGNNGTLYNGVGYSSTYGGGLVFDGVDDYIVIPGNGTINASRPTVELVMTTSTNGGNILAQGQYGSNWGFGVGVKPTNIMARNNSGDATISVNNSGLVHVVVVWDGSGNQYYKNGQYLGRTTANYSPNPGGDVTIGGVRNQVPSSTLTEFANSTVNIVRIYNRALSGAEILQNFNSIKTQFGL